MSERPENPELNLAAAYALGILSPDEARSFERTLATSEAARREVAEYREVSALLALQAPEAHPDPDLRGRVLARVEQEKLVPLPPAEVKRRPIALAWLAAAAAVIVALGLGWSLRGAKREIAERDKAVADLRAELSTSRQQLADRETALSTILEPGVRLTVLASSSAPAPAIQMLVNPRRGIAIARAVNLPPLASGRTYQLWFIPRGGKPIASVTFNAEASGHALVQNISLPQGAVLTAAAITEEPAGGSPQPTTAVLLSGAL